MNDYQMTYRTEHASVACALCLQPVFARGDGYVDASPADQVCRPCIEKAYAVLPRRVTKREAVPA